MRVQPQDLCDNRVEERQFRQRRRVLGLPEPAASLAGLPQPRVRDLPADLLLQRRPVRELVAERRQGRRHRMAARHGEREHVPVEREPVKRLRSSAPSSKRLRTPPPGSAGSLPRPPAADPCSLGAARRIPPRPSRLHGSTVRSDVSVHPSLATR